MKIIYLIWFFGLFNYNGFSQNMNMSYPYIASKERCEFVKENSKKIKVGNSEQEVRQILGTPEEIKPLYEAKIKTEKKLGYTYWYILKRLTEEGSQIDKAEKLVRISFNSNGSVVAIDSWGFED